MNGSIGEGVIMGAPVEVPEQLISRMLVPDVPVLRVRIDVQIELVVSPAGEARGELRHRG